MVLVIALWIGISHAAGEDDSEALGRPDESVRNDVASRFGRALWVGPTTCKLLVRGEPRVEVPLAPGPLPDVRGLPAGRIWWGGRNMRSALEWSASQWVRQRTCRPAGPREWSCLDATLSATSRYGTIEYVVWPAFANTEVLDALVSPCQFQEADLGVLASAIHELPRDDRLHVLAVLYNQLAFVSEAVGQDLLISQRTLWSCRHGRRRACDHVAEAVAGLPSSRDLP
jgi:hypothetical protein